MKELDRVNIEKFGIKLKSLVHSADKDGILPLYKAIYVYKDDNWIYGPTEYKEELPFVFETEEDAIDFIECGAKVIPENEADKMGLYSYRSDIFNYNDVIYRNTYIKTYYCKVPNFNNNEIIMVLPTGYDKFGHYIDYDTKGKPSTYPSFMSAYSFLTFKYYIVKGFKTAHTNVRTLTYTSSLNPKISEYIKSREKDIKNTKEYDERKAREEAIMNKYIEDIHEVKTYKVQKI